MLLTKADILKTVAEKTQTLDVPEWGPEAQVRIGVIGGLAAARLQDWLATLGRPVEGIEARQASRIEQLTQGLRALVEAAQSQPSTGSIGPMGSQSSPEALRAAIEEADQMLRDSLPDRTYSAEENYSYSLRWCAESIVTDSGERMFTLDEIEQLGRLDRAPVHRIAAAAQALNLATRQARKDAEKNSGTTPTGSGGSDTP